MCVWVLFRCESEGDVDKSTASESKIAQQRTPATSAQCVWAPFQVLLEDEAGLL